MKKEMELKLELESFQNLWFGGYDTNPDIITTYRNNPKIYEDCIGKYKNGAHILEIGPGKGGWTRKMNGAKKIYCLDALSKEHNNFDVNHSDIEYYKVEDFSCEMIPDNSIDLLFSYDVFCHISYSGTREYLKNVYPKLKNGANCFIMIADWNKYKNVNYINTCWPYKSMDEYAADYDGAAFPGRWYWYGIDNFCNILNEFSYKIINKDMNYDDLSPLCHFKK